MPKTFEVYRANNPRLHNLLNQEDQYRAYLKRIQSIVDKKPVQDSSPKFYMTFLHKTKFVSRQHKNIEYSSQILQENKILVNKLLNINRKKSSISNYNNQQQYSLAMYQKRYRDQQNIDQQNKKIVKRIISQLSFGRKSNDSFHGSAHNSPQKVASRKNWQSWHFDSLKARKLPKLVKHMKS